MTVHALTGCSKDNFVGRCGLTSRASRDVRYSGWEEDVDCDECMTAASPAQKEWAAIKRAEKAAGKGHPIQRRDDATAHQRVRTASSGSAAAMAPPEPREAPTDQASGQTRGENVKLLVLDELNDLFG